MKIFPALIATLALVSCDKAKDLADKAKSAVRDTLAENSAGNGGEVDPALQKLVDQTPEGVIFRKDLPFPPRVEVRTTRRKSFAGRLFNESAIEKRTDLMNGTETHVSKIERSADQVRYTLEDTSYSIPSADAKEEGKPATNPLEEMVPTKLPINFRRKGGSWTAEGVDTFRSAIISKQIIPVFDRLLVENAAAPRPLWFSKHRFKQGDQIVVTGETLPMLLAGGKKGSFTLVLDGFEAVDGHPCAFFKVTGDYSRKAFPDFEGRLMDEDVTITSGKIWLSLIHPIVLREELDTIQTFRAGGSGGLVSRGQGTVKVSVKRSWKTL